MGYIPTTGVFIRSKNCDPKTHREEWHGKTEADWGDTSVIQGTPKIASDQQKLGESYGPHSPSAPPEDSNPADTWISDY